MPLLPPPHLTCHVILFGVYVNLEPSLLVLQPSDLKKQKSKREKEIADEGRELE